ncbi:MAG: type II toxin-antitoxin system HicB family antitoxin [Boseongicola sp.]|nr:type II toxin-antitoxin system HicB family antitoxin [Boseongicola sp.]
MPTDLVSDIPGCHSAADDEEDLFPNACQPIILHLEGEEIPESRKIAGIRRLEKVRRVHARGAYLMSVPFLRTGGRKGRLNVTGDEQMISAIADAARHRGITRSAFLMQAARREIMRGGAESP